MLPGHVYLGLELAQDVHVAFRDASRERGDDGVLPVAIDDTAVNLLHKHLGVGHALADPVYDGLVALAVRVGHVVAQPDVAPLDDGVELGELSDNLVVKVVDAPVILAQLLDALGRDEAATDKFLHHALRYPPGILDIALVAGKLPDEVGVDELQPEVRLKHTPYRNPIDTRAFHAGLLYVMCEHQITHFL